MSLPTPPSADQPGSQSELIEALKNLDDPAGSQEGEEENITEEEKTFEKRKRKRLASKKKKHIPRGDEHIVDIETNPSAQPSPPAKTPSGRLEKSVIKSSSSSKGGKKK